MTNILDGKKLAKELELRLHEDITEFSPEVGRPPGLAVIRVGDDPASGIYVSNKEKACNRIGLDSFLYHLGTNTSEQEILEVIKALNNDQKVDGILLQLPLPKGLDAEPLLKAIDPEKDVDGLHTLNLGRLLKGEKGPRSCTPAGIMVLLRRNNISLVGKKVVVIGRSILVGKPMALMLQAANATVTVAHSKTINLPEITNQAEVLIVAAGIPQLIGLEHVRSNAVVVDVGIHRIPMEPLKLTGSNYKLCGDVRAEEIYSKIKAITPVPGGVGPMTVAMLMVNTVNRWQYHCGLSSTLSDLLP
ncbi:MULTISPECIES: bifunctional methylenetetrahydrofolate dehydrogenase/methenyltetrahydrofolate cyclohydrolase FolD [Prochlorococcus]|uniref:Bifunctional protein FolD n=1 Tax=Prochlorococcus marinus (strain SARG / CCMP1375 / SS120) TaxID=167539 RepID=FOLD_PROMA|nr:MULTISPECIES: bifunctional methylenetetrahydrofolate dehydrogenase/methenyltetrahydrofolate cyclohydrolase FolD [Prochlorococcus]Q7TVA3.1 RecName: Full=Bifunctional protein FolD; Includes: RecName: Full=Methylenetetrahydrofolate dehydrogenase; Includes: RecName: Full=Methenyltetrahydrofolate cyclohydrolase [Prochlorococcus marinus subsp. marinus str. CCMP1375]AAQ00175.1 5,10-methylene-tetrahydrofolate dehydrogenase/Methenyl tetrahydrofolate cyclohydrolase [Prochlorococcus marinus subsp. marinu